MRKTTAGDREQVGGGVKRVGGCRDGLTIRAQRAHFTHTSSKPMVLGLIAVERGKERGSVARKEREGLSFGSSGLHLSPSIKRGREAWSVRRHKINTDTKSEETEIKRVIDAGGEKVKRNRYRESRNEGKAANAEQEGGVRMGGGSSHSRAPLSVGMISEGGLCLLVSGGDDICV